MRMHKLAPNVAKAKIFPYEKEKQILNDLYDFMCHSASHPQRMTADESDSWHS